MKHSEYMLKHHKQILLQCCYITSSTGEAPKRFKHLALRKTDLLKLITLH